MSSTSTESVEPASGNASTYDADERQLWDQKVLDDELDKLKKWATTHDSISATQRIFVPKDQHLGIWNQSPNKDRCASFGEGGTTASVNCYGDLMQVSQYLGVGSSGVFTIDQDSTPEPYYVVARAHYLDSLARNMGSELSFRLIIPNDYRPDEDKPPEVRWLNWRWPRYQYVPRDNTEVKCCYQFMVHAGAVLQQFTLENTTEAPIEVGEFQISANFLIRDLDFLDDRYTFNETLKANKSHWSDQLGPDGYGHVYMHTLPHKKKCKDRCSDHAVAVISTTFVNGSAVKFDSKDKNTSIFLKGVELGGAASRQNKAEIVIARKLLVIPNYPIDWRNFVISATTGDINHWLRREEEALWNKGDSVGITRCLAKLSMATSKNSGTDAARGGGVSQGATEEEPASDRYEDDDGSRVGVQMHEGVESFEMPTQTPGLGKNWNPNNHLEYFAWRHLEHILSVCAVPLSRSVLIEQPNSEREMPSRDPSPPIALTCGDISGHRINSSASFFAFQFLIEMGRRLRLLEGKTKYTHSLETRIEYVCVGHIRWLQLIRVFNLRTEFTGSQPWYDEEMTTEHILRSGCFAANYWVTGAAMTENKTGYKTWLPQNRMTDTAFQILKLGEFMTFGDSMEGKRMAREVMNDIYIPWLAELDRLDIRKSCTWAHSNIEDSIKFRLDDHFWIWKALVCLNKMGTKISLPTDLRRMWLHRLHSKSSSQESTLTHEELESRSRNLMAIDNRLSPRNVQFAVLKNFATANDVFGPGQTMLAVTRSATKTRFLLHARDSALFYDDSDHFFTLGTSSLQPWENVIDAQLHHEENMDMNWHDSLRYALAIAMGVRGYMLSRMPTASELVQRSFNVLVKIGGSDAFFPGYLDELTKEPILLEDEKCRDKFYHANFEINYILLCNAHKINTISSRNGIGLNAESPQVATAPKARRQVGQVETLMTIENKGANIGVLQGTNSKTPAPGNQPQTINDRHWEPENSMHASNINYIDNEWLYPYPDFLRGRLVVEDLRAQQAPGAVQLRQGSLVSLHHKELEQAKSQFDTWKVKAEGNISKLAVHIVDIGEAELPHRARRFLRIAEDSRHNPRLKSFKSIKDICGFLEQPRTAIEAETRLVWLPHADFSTSIACCVLSPERERTELRKFFERHAAYAKHVTENTSLLLNRWQTELCLSFYYLFGPNDSLAQSWSGLPKQDGRPLLLPRRQKIEIRRASMAFRFDGDLFNRFWTCHFVEHMPNAKFSGAWDHNFDVKCESFADDQCSQRKVLELCFLQRILQKMNDESSRLLNEIRVVLNIKHSSLALAWFDLLDSDKPWNWEEVQKFEKYLQHVEEDLSGNLNVLLEEWNLRETRRGEEEPRWTQDDEKNHRVLIKKLSTGVQSATRDLQTNRDAMCKLKEFLSETRENFRDKLERARNEKDRENDQKDANIRNLTYVTLIFQPLGFAASFYSMSGTPDTALIVSLVECAAAAFFVTLVLIWAYRAFVTCYKTYALKRASHKPMDDTV